jgi:hypothetical protein
MIRKDSQKIVYILWNLKVHYCVHDSSPLDPVMHHINSVQTLISNLKVYFNIIPRSMHVAQVIYPPQVFQLIFCMYFSSVPCMLFDLTNPSYLTLF